MKLASDNLKTIADIYENIQPRVNNKFDNYSKLLNSFINTVSGIYPCSVNDDSGINGVSVRNFVIQLAQNNPELNILYISYNKVVNDNANLTVHTYDNLSNIEVGKKYYVIIFDALEFNYHKIDNKVIHFLMQYLYSSYPNTKVINFY